MQPTRQGSVFAHRPQSLGEYQERGLECILGILRVQQDPPADAIDHRTVAMHDGLKRRLVTSRERPFNELSVGLVLQRLRRHSARQATEKVAQVCHGHACASQPRSVLRTVVPAESKKCSHFRQKATAGAFHQRRGGPSRYHQEPPNQELSCDGDKPTRVGGRAILPQRPPGYARGIDRPSPPRGKRILTGTVRRVTSLVCWACNGV